MKKLFGISSIKIYFVHEDCYFTISFMEGTSLSYSLACNSLSKYILSDYYFTISFMESTPLSYSFACESKCRRLFVLYFYGKVHKKAVLSSHYFSLYWWTHAKCKTAKALSLY